MTDKKDTDPQSLRGARDQISAIGVRLDDIEARLNDNDLAHKILDADLLDIRTCWASVLTAMAEVEAKLEALSTVVAASNAAAARQPSKRAPAKSRGLTKAELALILLAIVLIIGSVWLSTNKYLR